MLLEDHLSQYINIFTPRNPADRGCQLSLTFPAGNMMEVFSKLCEAGVICDERKPDVIRVAPTPLYNSYADVWELVEQVMPTLLRGVRSPCAVIVRQNSAGTMLCRVTINNSTIPYQTIPNHTRSSRLFSSRATPHIHPRSA